MARDLPSHAAATLRALTYRISSCPPTQLPRIAPQIAASLSHCRSILSAPSDTAKVNSDASQATNRFRTTLSQLLQSRTVEERWAAVVLAKAALEAGRLDMISKAAGWTKSLIAILKKDDPSSTKAMAIVTLTRLFTLSWQDTNLVREITTPALPGFVQACIATADRSSNTSHVLQATLEAFATLLPRHPTTFRTFEGQLRTLLLRILSATPSGPEGERAYSTRHRAAAGKLFVLLHHCAPKQGGPEKWSDTLAATVAATHATADRVFRSVAEYWKSTAGVAAPVDLTAGELRLDRPDALGLPAWHGPHAGAERLASLIELVQAHFECTTSGTVSFRVGIILDLTNRLLALDTSTRDETTSFVVEIPKDEREAMFSILPQIHVATLGLLRVMLERFGYAIVSLTPCIIESLVAPFAAECGDAGLRQATYQVLADLLLLNGPSLSKGSVADLALPIRHCCEDSLPVDTTPDHLVATISGPAAQRQSATHGFADESQRGRLEREPHFSALRTAATRLLPILITTLDQAGVSSSLRSTMEQTAVLARNKNAIVACVLNPTRQAYATSMKPSLLPLLAKEFADCAAVEAILRPRMPVAGGTVGTRSSRIQDGMDEDEHDPTDDGEGKGDVPDGISVESKVAVEERATGTPAPPFWDMVGDTRKEVFNTSQEQPTCITSPRHSNKRSALDTETPEEINAKRLRAPPIASTLLPEPASSLSGAHADMASDIKMPITSTSPRRADMVTVPASAQAGDKAPTAKEEDEDGSDFEIPPLTMATDSEDEDA